MDDPGVKVSRTYEERTEPFPVIDAKLFRLQAQANVSHENVDWKKIGSPKVQTPIVMS
jgi:hypothetical protein